MLDGAGSVLVAAVGVEQTRTHDGTLAALVAALKWVGAVVNREVRHVFSGAVAAARAVAGQDYGGGGVNGAVGDQWKRPDFSVYFPGAGNGHGVVRYYEWKIATLNDTRYPVARESNSGRRWGAQRRASAVHTDYDGAGAVGSGDGAARDADMAVNGRLGDGDVGSIRERWRRGWVVSCPLQ